jgi:hypothetical protein
MKLKSAALLVLATLAAAAVASSTAARAQQPAVFEVFIPADSLNTPTGPFPAGGPATLREFLGLITVRANGAVCLTVDLRQTTSDVLMQVGLPGQASPCTQDGSVVTFNDGHGGELAMRMVLRLGTRERLFNLAPIPPGQKQPLSPMLPPLTWSEPPPSVPRVAIAPPQAGDGALVPAR